MSIHAANSEEFFSLLISNIKTYNGSDPLRPWLQGIKKMEDRLPSQILREKLPRFLQKCIKVFQYNRRYRNDSRYVGVWIRLMDFVDEPKALLRMMEKNKIGMKHASFYMAFALLHEKRKMFEEAEKMYFLGVKNLAEPVAELHKGYEKFLRRFEQYKKRKSEVTKSVDPPPRDSIISRKEIKGLDNTDQENLRCTKFSLKNAGHSAHLGSEINEKELETVNDLPRAECFLKDNRQCSSVSSDDTVVVKFVGSAIIGRSEAEDVCHHGLVDPTINTKEAMNAISNMFKEPLEAESKVKRKAKHEQSKVNHASSGFEVFVDDCEGHDKEDGCHDNSAQPIVQMKTENHNPLIGTFQILADDDNDDENGNGNDNNNNNNDDDNEEECDGHDNFVFCQTMKDPKLSVAAHLNGDTIIHRFVGSTILSEPEVENACHHGLVDPTINLKEAMDDINGMFGKPINFVRPRRTTSKQSASSQQKQATSQGFSILADDDDDMKEEDQLKMHSLGKSCVESDLFEPTIFTKEAIDEINSMFGNPLDF